VLLIEPVTRGDARGWFLEAWRQKEYAEIGISGPFVQDNVSRSAHGVLRGLHFQEPHGQGKLVQVLEGAVWDVALDVRRGSPTFGRWVALELRADQQQRQIWIPPGFAHGFCVTSETALILYKCTEPYAPDAERVIAWNDPSLGIPWPIRNPTLSARDAAAPLLATAPVLPSWRPGVEETSHPKP
jgi:dTDP-4-dehydrorhamnose 3,5-epimerase